MEKLEQKKWYNNADSVVNIIIGLIVAIIICSQSFAIGGELTLFGSVINHNSIYFILLIYFIFLKFPFGKKYFNYMNVILIFLYFIIGVTSLLTVAQSFSLHSVLSFTLDFILLVYVVHSFLRGTRVWKDFRLYNSPFNELTNEWLFYSVLVVSIFLLAVNLISTVVASGVMLSILDALFTILFGRYIFLYHNYLDVHQIDVDNEGNFDEIKENIKEVVENVSEEIQEHIQGEESKEEKAEEPKVEKKEEPKKKTTDSKKTTKPRKKKGEE